MSIRHGQPEGGHLGEEYFFPDCPCGAPGDLLVIRAGGSHRKARWHCLECEDFFDVPKSSPWYGVEELRDFRKEAYIQCCIVGRDPAEYASNRKGINPGDVRRYIKEAHTRLNGLGRHPAATQATGAD